MTQQDQATLDHLQSALNTLLPDQYQDPAHLPAPTPMGSAALQFNPDGTVAWDKIWGSFCHLALAGGPPHRGTLLSPGTQLEIAANPGRHRQVLAEITRGITLVTTLEAEPSRHPGWVRVPCPTPVMAGWLLRAITIENVAVHAEDATLYLPAAPHYRLEKEIKNVITVIAKTTHYWRHHIPPTRHQAMANVFAQSPLIQPTFPTPTWYPIVVPTLPAALWITRHLIAANILARREAQTVYLPLKPQTNPTFTHLHHLATTTNILLPPEQ